MSGELSGKRVLVTGAASGIGRAIADRFAEEGASLILVDVDGAGLDAAVLAARASGADTVGHVTDLADEDAVAALAADVGVIDVLVNQAGIIRRGDVRTQSFADFERIQRVNVASMFLTARAFVPGMIEKGAGVIVNCSSGAAFESGRGLAAYSASKGAVVAFTRALAVDFAPTVRVNAVCPGLIDTPGAYVDADDQMREDREAAARRTPLARMGTPAEVADAVLFLASDRSSFCTGIALMVDGGKLAGA
ncbi:MAG TPA: SDR family NAD(P)-dependent oxidoreductase [Pseudolysinimonas sp.]|jgi:NAD(P)-dependent dehydrogenase (short-subunit alcohol dehydrogenase family)|nr:SDR family NAD(P)-dependent oxidoreductase [Pseudolysinimonas sp.]